MQAPSTPRLGRALSALAALAFCGVASAALQPSTASVQFDFTKATTQTTWTSQQTLSKFDPTLGTLTSVDFFLGGTMVTTPVLRNDSPNSSSDITNTTTGTYSIMMAGMTPTTVYSNSSTPYTTSATVAPNSSAQTTPTTLAFASKVQSYSAVSDLARFIGPGSISLTLSATALSTGTGTNGNEFIGNMTTANGVGYVRYNYIQATPEPTSLAALSIGVVAFVRRRKAAKR